MWVHQIKNSLTPPMPELKATPTEQTELFPSAATFQNWVRGVVKKSVFYGQPDRKEV